MLHSRKPRPGLREQPADRAGGDRALSDRLFLRLDTSPDIPRRSAPVRGSPSPQSGHAVSQLPISHLILTDYRSVKLGRWGLVRHKLCHRVVPVFLGKPFGHSQTIRLGTVLIDFPFAFETIDLNLDTGNTFQLCRDIRLRGIRDFSWMRSR